MLQRIQKIAAAAALISFFIVLCISFVTIALQIDSRSFRQNSHLDVEYREIQIVVQPGDTLWSIAKSHVPDQIHGMSLGRFERETNCYQQRCIQVKC